MDELFHRLLTAGAPSGYEGAVQDIFRERMARYVDSVETDTMGNVIGEKRVNDIQLNLCSGTEGDADGTLRRDRISGKQHRRQRIPVRAGDRRDRHRPAAWTEGGDTHGAGRGDGCVRKEGHPSDQRRGEEETGDRRRVA